MLCQLCRCEARTCTQTEELTEPRPPGLAAVVLGQVLAPSFARRIARHATARHRHGGHGSRGSEKSPSSDHCESLFSIARLCEYPDTPPRAAVCGHIIGSCTANEPRAPNGSPAFPASRWSAGGIHNANINNSAPRGLPCGGADSSFGPNPLPASLTPVSPPSRRIGAIQRPGFWLEGRLDGAPVVAAAGRGTQAFHLSVCGKFGNIHFLAAVPARITAS